ncbi:MAG TPA: hypothetical protein PKE12_12840 [Kiritimatiellia bacterium]|nr:hypothetical protein [Kiritimatiellia bacterium]
MMHWWTDRPEAMRGFVPPGAAWTAAQPDAAFAPIWQAVGGGSAAWRATGPISGSAYPARAWVLIDTAEASQFTGLNDALGRGARAPDGLVCIALTGRKFHGQHARPWQAERGNLHLTAFYTLDLPVAALQAGLTMAPAVAVARAIRALSEGRLAPRIKWVNDVLLEERKVAGVLTATAVQGDCASHAVFGIGINVDCAPALSPEACAPRAGALADADPALRGALPRVLSAVVAALDDAVAQLRAGDATGLYAEYREALAYRGRRVRVLPLGADADPAAPLAEGVLEDVLPDLTLRLSSPGARIDSGRLALAT